LNSRKWDISVSIESSANISFSAFGLRKHRQDSARELAEGIYILPLGRLLMAKVKQENVTNVIKVPWEMRLVGCIATLIPSSSQ
jgi:hypothetical protein